MLNVRPNFDVTAAASAADKPAESPVPDEVAVENWCHLGFADQRYTHGVENPLRGFVLFCLFFKMFLLVAALVLNSFNIRSQISHCICSCVGLGAHLHRCLTPHGIIQEAHFRSLNNNCRHPFLPESHCLGKSSHESIHLSRGRVANGPPLGQSGVVARPGPIPDIIV